jgi:hypothetical protein
MVNNPGVILEFFVLSVPCLDVPYCEYGCALTGMELEYDAPASGRSRVFMVSGLPLKGTKLEPVTLYVVGAE